MFGSEEHSYLWIPLKYEKETDMMISHFLHKYYQTSIETPLLAMRNENIWIFNPWNSYKIACKSHVNGIVGYSPWYFIFYLHIRWGNASAFFNTDAFFSWVIDCVSNCKAIWWSRKRGITQVSATRQSNLKKGSKHKAFCSRGGAYAQILREGHLCQRVVMILKGLNGILPSRLPAFTNSNKDMN